jgi:hypothetical protein
MEHIGTNKVVNNCHLFSVSYGARKLNFRQKGGDLVKFGDMNANQGLTDRSFLTLLISSRCVN